MPDENYRILMEHQLIVKDDKGCRTYPLIDSDYEIGKSAKLPICLKTRSPLVAPLHATLVRLEQVQSADYQLIASFSPDDSGEYKLLVNGIPIQTHDLHDGDIIEFAAGVSAIYRYSRLVEPLTTNFSEGCIDFSYYGLGNLFA